MWICLIIFKIEFWIVRYHCWKLLSIIIVTVVQQSMNKENIKRMKVLDDETIDKDPVDGDLLTRDIVHYVGKKPKRSIKPVWTSSAKQTRSFLPGPTWASARVYNLLTSSPYHNTMCWNDFWSSILVIFMRFHFHEILRMTGMPEMGQRGSRSETNFWQII